MTTNTPKEARLNKTPLSKPMFTIMTAGCLSALILIFGFTILPQPASAMSFYHNLFNDQPSSLESDPTNALVMDSKKNQNTAYPHPLLHPRRIASKTSSTPRISPLPSI
jgi:hypothetical protein